MRNPEAAWATLVRYGCWLSVCAVSGCNPAVSTGGNADDARADAATGDRLADARTGDGPVLGDSSSLGDGIPSGDGSGDGTSLGDGAIVGDSASPTDGGQPGDSVAAGDNGGNPYPVLGLYVVGLDGSGLALLDDLGSNFVTHIRAKPGTDWLTATRYTQDLDGNGYAMELEAGFPLTYAGTEVVVFTRASPTARTPVAGGVAGKMCANASWTGDDRLIFIQQDHPTEPTWTRIKRARFSTLPAVSGIDTVATPPEILVPVDAHQRGASDATGIIAFVGTFSHPNGWMRPVWTMPASGAATMAGAAFFGCPICPAQAGCCAWTTPDDVRGANDPRIDNGRTTVLWMQQHPDIYFGVPPDDVSPYRQVKRTFSGTQVDLVDPGIAATTTQTYGEWRPDDGELAYWTLEVVGGALKQHLYRMQPDGTARLQMPLPATFCPTNPSYLNNTELVFSAWQCAGANCTCDIAEL